jgi:hypothetical protein
MARGTPSAKVKSLAPAASPPQPSTFFFSLLMNFRHSREGMRGNKIVFLCFGPMKLKR